jgi:hypothetical protein
VSLSGPCLLGSRLLMCLHSDFSYRCPQGFDYSAASLARTQARKSVLELVTSNQSRRCSCRRALVPPERPLRIGQTDSQTSAAPTPQRQQRVGSDIDRPVSATSRYGRSPVRLVDMKTPYLFLSSRVIRNSTFLVEIFSTRCSGRRAQSPVLGTKPCERPTANCERDCRLRSQLEFNAK